MKGKKVILLFVLFFIISANLSFLYNFLNFSGYSVNLTDKSDIKSASYWNLTGSNIFIDDLNPSYNWAYTASLYDWCSGSGTLNNPYIIENVTINGQGSGTGIRILNSEKYFKIKNCTIFNSTTGILLSSVINGTIINNTLKDNTNYGLFLDGDCEDNVIKGNQIINNGEYGLYLFSHSNDNFIETNNVSNNQNHGIWLREYCNRNVVFNNTIDENVNIGVVVSYYSSYNKILNNSIKYNGMFGIGFIQNCDDSIISNNLIIGSGQYGLRVYATCLRTNITENTIAYSSSHGILIQYTEPSWKPLDDLIFKNNISYSGGSGIHLVDGSYLTCTDNIISNNENGIYLESGFDRTKFIGNIINNNLNYGIYTADGSRSNSFSNNYFNGNLNNARDSSSNGNSWNIGTLGNYWDDYSGVDSNDDGIGDTPYPVGGDNQILDDYPIWEDGDDIPVVNINKPLNGTFYGSNSPNYEVLIDAGDLNTSWYSLDNGLNYTFTSLSGIINQSAWDACDNGTVKIEFFVNDTAGNLGYAEVDVYKDIYIPSITIISPKQDQLFSYDTIDFEIFIDESNLNFTWYTVNGGLNYLFNGISGTINSTAWENCINGSVIIRFYANDSAGNVGFNEVIIRKDIEKPNISIISPTPFQLFGNITFNFELLIKEGNLNTTWYTLDNGLNNYTFLDIIGIIDQDAWKACDNGTVTLHFYANDSVGNIANKEIFVRKDKINPTIDIITPEPLNIFGNATFSYEIHIEEANLHSIWYSFNNGINNYFINQSIGIIDQEAWNQVGNGTVLLNFYANDSLGNLGTSEVTFRKNIYAPVIIFNYSIAYLNTTTPEYYHKGLEISCEILNFTSLLWTFICENSSGLMENRSMTDLGNGRWTYTIDITALEWEDQISFHFLTKDLSGYTSINNNFSNMYIIKIYDFQAPIITINSPFTNQLYGVQAPTFKIDINELYIQEKWYSFNGGDNITFTTEIQFDQTEWANIGNGTVLIRFFVNDLAGNSNFSEVIVRKDAYLPDITIHSPTSDESFTNRSPGFNISIIEGDLISIWYTIEGSIIQYPITGLTGTIDQDVWNDIPQGEVTISFYAQDRAGNIGTESIVVTKSIPSPSPPVISGYSIFLLVGVISIVLAISIKKQKHSTNSN